MYAIIEDSGQQFQVSEGDVLNVDVRDVPEDQTQVEFDRVLLISGGDEVKVGTPLVDGAKVVADVVDPAAKGKKIHSYYWRRRKGSQKKIGHRQPYLKVRVASIQG
ncbi:MAG: 50S ribosomal protein L21 [Planctomycetota bacterium]